MVQFESRLSCNHKIQIVHSRPTTATISIISDGGIGLQIQLPQSRPASADYDASKGAAESGVRTDQKPHPKYGTPGSTIHNTTAAVAPHCRVLPVA
ncbi:hypothetical protein N7475_009947 [Penicillium sp. IBT 31633x]|nr:hypothetical protein N7475_009947 [Penicillium sp. IBT 31633x]